MQDSKSNSEPNSKLNKNGGAKADKSRRPVCTKLRLNASMILLSSIHQQMIHFPNFPYKVHVKHFNNFFFSKNAIKPVTNSVLNHRDLPTSEDGRVENQPNCQRLESIDKDKEDKEEEEE